MWVCVCAWMCAITPSWLLSAIPAWNNSNICLSVGLCSCVPPLEAEAGRTQHNDSFMPCVLVRGCSGKQLCTLWACGAEYQWVRRGETTRPTVAAPLHESAELWGDRTDSDALKHFSQQTQLLSGRESSAVEMLGWPVEDHRWPGHWRYTPPADADNIVQSWLLSPLKDLGHFNTWQPPTSPQTSYHEDQGLSFSEERT